jgi:hypothetical protein
MFPTQITLRNLRPSVELTDRIRDLCEKLGHLHPHILTCRVQIEQMLVRSRRAVPPPSPYFVDVLVRLPGRMITAQPQQDLQLDLALRKAFVLVRRQLREACTIDRETMRERPVAKLKL